LFDSDRSGSIDPKELKEVMLSMGFDAKNNAVYQIISDLDSDGSGAIDFEEYVCMMTPTKADDDDDESYWWKIFYMFDVERKGTISLKDLTRVAKELGEIMDTQELTAMWDKGDINRDEQVNFEDFYKIMTKKTK